MRCEASWQYYWCMSLWAPSFERLGFQFQANTRTQDLIICLHFFWLSKMPWYFWNMYKDSYPTSDRARQVVFLWLVLTWCIPTVVMSESRRFNGRFRTFVYSIWINMIQWNPMTLIEWSQNWNIATFVYVLNFLTGNMGHFMTLQLSVISIAIPESHSYVPNLFFLGHRGVYIGKWIVRHLEKQRNRFTGCWDFPVGKVFVSEIRKWETHAVFVVFFGWPWAVYLI